MTYDYDKATEIIGDDSLTENEVMSLVDRAERRAVNYFFWSNTDRPTDEEKEAFLEMHEYDIYEIASTLVNSIARGGLVSHTELGITDNWGKSGSQSVDEILGFLIGRKTYVV